MDINQKHLLCWYFQDFFPQNKIFSEKSDSENLVFFALMIAQFYVQFQKNLKSCLRENMITDWPANLQNDTCDSIGPKTCW